MLCVVRCVLLERKWKDPDFQEDRLFAVCLFVFLLSYYSRDRGGSTDLLLRCVRAAPSMYFAPARNKRAKTLRWEVFLMVLLVALTTSLGRGHATRYNISKGDKSAKYNYKLRFRESRS